MKHHLKQLITFLAPLLIILSASKSYKAQGQIQSPCPRASKVNTNYHFRETLHFICLQASNSQQQPKLDVIQFTNQQVVLSKTVPDVGASELATFVDLEGTLRILLAVPDRLNGTSMYSLTRDGVFLNETHTINTQFVSAMSIWRLDLNWDWNLAIANQPFKQMLLNEHNMLTRRPIREPKPLITFHSWRSTYFDSYQTIELPNDGQVNKLQPMNINGQELLVVAMESHASLRMTPNIKPIESLIYKLDFGDGNLRWFKYQTLDTVLAIDVRSFVVSHKGSFQRDYYIALIGQVSAFAQRHLRRNSAQFNDEYGLIIYKYMGDQFMLTNVIPAPSATKLDTISYGSGDSYVVIALLSEFSNQVNLYLFDGLSLKPLPSPFRNLPPPNNREPLNFATHRPRRTMDTANVHLFLPPQEEQNNGTSSTAQKRTLVDNNEQEQQLSMPALAFSMTNLESNYKAQTDNNNTGQEMQPKHPSVYQISASDMLNSDLAQINQQDSSNYTKRDQIIVQNNDQYLPLFEWCKSTLSLIAEDDFDSTQKQLSSLPRVDQHRPIEINGDLIIEDSLLVSNLLFANKIAEVGGRQNLSVVASEQASFSAVFNQIQETHSMIDSVKSRIDQILVDDGSPQDIFEPLTFGSLIVECGHSAAANLDPRAPALCPHVNEIQASSLNGHPIDDLQKQALLTGRSTMIDSDVRFEHLILRGSVDILGTLNELSVSNIVFKVGPTSGPIVGHKSFQNGLSLAATPLQVQNWNDHIVDRQNYLLSSGDQRVEADIRFNTVVLEPSAYNNMSSRFERLNGMHLDAHLGQIALADGANNFELPVHFEELILNGPTYFKAQSYLSSVDLDDLWRNTMFKHSNQNITAPMEFSANVHVSYGGDMIVSGPINGIPFGPELIMMRNRDYVLNNPLVFEGDLRVERLQLEKALNGIQVVDAGLNQNSNKRELAILYDGGVQFLTGDKVFNDVHLGGNSTIRGAINGHLNLSELHKLATNNEPHRFSTVRLSGRDIRISNRTDVHIDRFINGIPANELCSLANRVATQNVTSQYNRLRFEDTIKFKSIRCASINGFNNLTNAFLMRHGNQHVAGTLKLVNGAVFNTTLNIHSSLNELSIAPLARAIIQANNDTLTGHRDIRGDLIVDDLITDKINNLRLTNVFLTKSDAPQIVRAPMAFDHLDIENVLIVGNNLRTHSFNGLNVTDILSNTLQYDTPQIIYNHVEVNTLHLLPNSNFLTKSLNGFDLNRLYSDAVLLDVPQQIMAPKSFRAPVEFVGRTFTRHGIDGVSNEEFRFNLLLQSDELIDGDIEFNNDVTIRKELEILSGSINDIDVNVFVDSMLYENRPNQNGLRIVGNGSVRFRDVKLNNLVVAGTIQGVDLSKEALTRNENRNGSFNEQIRDQQYFNNNQRLLNSYGPDSNFRVFTNYRGHNHTGSCYVHTCSRTTLAPAIVGQPAPPAPTPEFLFRPTPPALSSYVPLKFTYAPPVMPAPAPAPAPRPIQTHQYYPTVAHIPVPFSLVAPNVSHIANTWRPIISHTIVNPNVSKPLSTGEFSQIVDPKYLEYKMLLQAQAIKDLSLRVNKYLSISYFYEIVQKHPLLGPLLAAANNPILNEEGSAFLLLKGTSRFGEPCLQKSQSIAVMAQQRQRNTVSLFTQSSLLQETSNPNIVESIVVNQAHYLIVLDLSSGEHNAEPMSQILVYLWDYQSGRYELRERIPVDGYPSAMKAFSVESGLVCVALANPKLLAAGGLLGAPTLYCQQPGSLKLSSKRLTLPIASVFDLDVINVAPKSRQIIIAALSQRDTEQIGDLSVSSYDLVSGSLVQLSLRRLARPLKLRLFRNGLRPFPIQLVVSEAITSNHDEHAITRIFSLLLKAHSFGAGAYHSNSSLSLYESQIIRDSQFYDIQTVMLNNMNSMLFLQSAHFISIYAPTATQQNDALNCGSQYSLIQRLPTKGANKFLVFNNQPRGNRTNVSHYNDAPYGHFLVLSKEDCEQQQYSTVILSAKFK